MRRNKAIHSLRRLAAAFLAVFLLTVALAPTVLAAEGTADTTAEENAPPNVPTFTVTVIEKDPETSGTCGDNLTWSYALGTLTIVGSGAMTDFVSNEMAPWYPFHEEITRVVLPEGLTSIGNLAFYECTKLKALHLPDDLRRVGYYAFTGCTAMEILTMGKSLTAIHDGAFSHCTSLTTVSFPYGLQTLGTQAFYRCESLTVVNIPTYVENMGTSVFAYCKNLLRATINARLQELPAWTFYGCERLTVVSLPETVSTLRSYAFVKCDGLSTVYFDGEEEASNTIREEIAQDIPGFDVYGYVTSGTPSHTVSSALVEENGDGTITQENTVVRVDDNATVVVKVEHTHPEGTTGGGTYTADITVTLENENGWESATNATKNALKDINDGYATVSSAEDKTTLTVIIKDGSAPDSTFVQEMAERDLTMTVVTESGDSWHVDCETLEKEALTGNYNFSYIMDAPAAGTIEALGTEDCYKVTFEENAEINAEILVKLPGETKGANAFLYQVEEDGSHTRLQATAIDNDGNAHFYVAKVDKDTEYVVGVNVPGEKTDDVIIPDALFDKTTQGAIERLEEIEFVVTGVESSWGLSFFQVTLILAGVLVATIVAVGIILGMWNKQRLKRGYVPDVREYEEK